MEDKFKGIITKLTEYKDADKLASVFSLENGLITVKFTGVKKENAKFKSSAQPFTFAEFVVTQKGANKTVISVDIIDSFKNILTDYNKTICGYIILDVINTLLIKEKQEQDIFILTINSLKNVEEKNPFVFLIDYLLKFIEFSGMGLQFIPDEYVYLDKFTGDFIPNHTQNSVQIDKKVYFALTKIHTQQQLEENETILRQCLRLLHNIFYLKFGEDIKSFQFI